MSADMIPTEDEAAAMERVRAMNEALKRIRTLTYEIVCACNFKARGECVVEEIRRIANKEITR